MSLPSKVRTLGNFVIQMEETFDKIPSSLLVLPWSGPCDRLPPSFVLQSSVRRGKCVLLVACVQDSGTLLVLPCPCRMDTLRNWPCVPLVCLVPCCQRTLHSTQRSARSLPCPVSTDRWTIRWTIRRSVSLLLSSLSPQYSERLTAPPPTPSPVPPIPPPAVPASPAAFLPVKGDGRVLLTGWLPDYGSGFPPSSSIPVSWATWTWTWTVLGILFIVTPSSIGSCLRLAALQPSPLVTSTTLSSLVGKTWSEVVEVQDFCLLSADVTGTALNSCSPQTDCVVRNEVTQSLAWRGNAPSFWSRSPGLPRRCRSSSSRGWLTGVQWLWQSVRSRWAGRWRRRGDELQTTREA